MENNLHLSSCGEEINLGQTSSNSGLVGDGGQLTASADSSLQRRCADLQKLTNRQIYQEDLNKIKTSFPDCQIDNVQQLGRTFCALRANGIDPLIAYKALQGEEKPKPPSIGSVKSSGKTNDSEFFSESELDALTDKDLDNVAVYEKARRSLLKIAQQKIQGRC